MGAHVPRRLRARQAREKNLQPSPDADRATLIRRATLDTWGCVPTPEEVKAFVKDHSPKAYEKVVDRLLASPRYGERWGRRWLDLTRYADSDGYNADGTRPNAWRYRDYVIAAFNSDKPYDQFVKEQLAGRRAVARSSGRAHRDRLPAQLSRRDQRARSEPEEAGDRHRPHRHGGLGAARPRPSAARSATTTSSTRFRRRSTSSCRRSS